MAIPMLEDHEWEQVQPLIKDAIESIGEYREKRNARRQDAGNSEAGNLEARDFVWDRALGLYREMTGFHETNINAL
jgi:hypothetical protein